MNRDTRDFERTGWAVKEVKLGDAVANLENLFFLKEIAEAGKLVPVIGRCYPLEWTAKAFQYAEKGHKKGNVVIAVEHKSKT